MCRFDFSLRNFAVKLHRRIFYKYFGFFSSGLSLEATTAQQRSGEWPDWKYRYRGSNLFVTILFFLNFIIFL